MTYTNVNVYPPGNETTVTGMITDAVGTPFNPTTVIFHVTDGQGVKTAYTYGEDAVVTNPTVGTFVLTLFVPYDNSAGGNWFYGLQGLNALGQSIFFTRNLFQISTTETL